MSDRVNPFANIKDDPPVFTTKPRAEKPVAEEAIARIAEQNNFPSRQAARPAKAERRKPRIHRTGRNVQFNAKATAETISRVYKQAEEMKVTLGEWMERAANALERAAASGGPDGSQ
jgi:methylmalonyl-CoA mutase N-terminal domain/subunit